ncbi:cytosine-purine permease [Roridomyces roridus]|uniref:Cytosine-purine permease n=1 Tax=Roridomyces roridus TaxID=1738132 RepID=A0AAD7C1V3_9AGAR|nr:cytosine-purine permease [Roridomyces roridus]
MSSTPNEKDVESLSLDDVKVDVARQESPVTSIDEKSKLYRLTRFLGRYGVETHGIAPIPEEERVDTKRFQLFMIWFSSNMNLTNLTSGAAGPVAFRLSFRDSAIVFLVADVLSLLIPATFGIFGPQLGTRSMVQARFSWGYYGAILPSIFNVASMMGYLILGVMVGGQLLAGASGHLSSTDGIVILTMLSFVVTFCGYKFIHWFACLAWIPSLLGMFVMLGVGGKHLHPSNYAMDDTPPATAAAVLSFAATVGAANLAWCTMTPDYGVYHDARSSPMIFARTYFGLFIPSLMTHLLGAAFASAASSVPAWAAAYEGGNNTGGLVAAILEPVHGFGKFLLVTMALSIVGACGPIMYSFGMSLMNVHPVFAKIPRYIFAMVATAIGIPLAIYAERNFYSSLVTFLDIIGYWTGSFSAIILMEHVVFRRLEFTRYKVEEWNNPRKLPPGLAAVLAFALSFALIVPCMDQSFFVGPLAKKGTGDLGIMVGFALTCITYTALRAVEKWLFPSHDA